MPKVLDEKQIARWHRDGALWPIDLLSTEQAADYRDRFEALEASIDGEVQDRFRIKAHLPFPWLWDLITHPRLVDVVEDLLGPDIVCWGSSFFTKKAHDPRFISWHQDSTYYGLEPPESITAWVAFTSATSQAGCMKIIPGSHRGPAILPHDETRDPMNLLSRGQTIRDLDASCAVEMPLEAGQMSVHHNKTIHSSEPNAADWPRIGYAIHLAASGVRQTQFDNATAICLRGGKGDWIDDPVPERELSPDSLLAVDEYWHRYKTAMSAQR